MRTNLAPGGIGNSTNGERSFEGGLVAKRRRILVADDDRIMREIIGAIPIGAGHDVGFAE